MTSPETNKKYKTIVIDPPWKAENSGVSRMDKFNRKELPYQTMTDDEILTFPIYDFAEENCNLFMWVTLSKLPAGLDIVKEWGFKYHTIMAWDKASGVCLRGFYRRIEPIIFAYRGKFSISEKEGSYLPTLFKQQATVHSQKPTIFYEFLRARTPEPRIDIFARKRHFGFDAYGDQVEKSMEMPLA
jgi:N6-adenosine-specific RNA methylase IME4